MLALTQDAADAIGVLLEKAPLPESGGLRIACAATNDGVAGLRLALADAPEEADAVMHQDAARVFLEPEAATMLSDQVLDARVEEGGSVTFQLLPHPPVAGP